MSIMPYLFEYKTALAVMFMQYLVVSIYSVVIGWKKVDIKMAMPCLIGNATGLIIGYIFLAMIKADYITRLLGIFLILLAIYFLFLNNRWRIKPTFGKGLALGNLSGVLGGLFGIGGPPLSIYLVNATDDIFVYLVNIQLSYGVGTAISAAMHASAGRYTPSVIGVLIVSLIPVIAGCMLGRSILKRFDKEKFNKIIYVFMIFMGAMLVIK
jgi:uncharacterized membrane protein YfcA